MSDNSNVKIIQSPTQGRVVLFDATHLRPGDTPVVVPAHIHQVIDRDLVTVWGVDKAGETLRAVGGGLPAARFGEVKPGVPAPERWCYPVKLDLSLEVPERFASDFDPEATLTF
jgi:hypothetical protein